MTNHWIAADILRIENELLVEYWDVIQDEATEEQSKSGAPCSEILFRNTNERDFTGD